MKCLVVGGAGFISGHLIDSLLASGRFSDVATLDNYFLGQRLPEQSDFRADATDLGSVTTVLETFQPNLVIDLSTKPIPNSLVFPREGFLNLEHLPERQGDVSRHCGDSSRLFQLANWRPRPISVDLVTESIAEAAAD